MVGVAIYAEGPTEWIAAHRLHERGLLANADIVGGTERGRGKIDRWIKSRDQLKKAMVEEPPFKRILLLFDQEGDASPSDTATSVFGDDWTSTSWDNVFLWKLENNRKVVLHVATACSPDGNRDFDGYLVQILAGLGPKAASLWFERNTDGRPLKA